MGISKSAVVEGWFTTRGRLGDRTIDEQKEGLDWLLANCAGKSILDVGCAEGLLSIEMVHRGATAVHGVEIVPDHVEVGRKLGAKFPVCFEVGDANTWTPKREYDIVVMLALLHKLKNPTSACRRFVDAAREAVVIRLPPLHSPTIVDPRSDNNPHHIADVMSSAGFTLLETQRGPRNEWVGVYLRNK